MAIIEARTPLELDSGSPPPVARHMGALTRPQQTTGWRSWLTTVDHKKIGIMYGAGGLFFFLIGGLEALLIRAQLAVPGSKLLDADVYNQVFTMHGVTMVFLVITPIAAAFANYLIPLQIGARDVAFPRLNALSFWTWFFGSLLLNSSWILGGAPDGGWFNYVPNAGPIYSPGHGIDFYLVGLLLAGVASTVSAVNLAVTVINLRAPGMTWFKVPVFTWMNLVVQFLFIFSLPVITLAFLLLMLDRWFGSTFYDPAHGGDPLLWQHLFWIFGHPEVYILVLPSFGIVSEVIPTFSRKPIFGYPFMVFSGVTIGFLGFGVWAHHMFASGMGPMSVTAFSLATMFIAVPTGVKILNWVATMVGGRLKFEPAMLFAIGLVSMFTIGGLSGVSHSIAPADTQQHDTYYIVAHFHYVLFGGALLGQYAGMYFWWPKVFGYKLNAKLGKAHFWTTLFAFNLTFAPQHIVGLQGMSRRYHSYSEADGFGLWNLVSTIGAFLLGATLLLFLWTIWVSYRDHRRNPVDVGPDPWDARGLEWMVPSPTPEHNFDTIPEVTELDHFWHLKYGHDEEGRAVRIAETADVTQDGSAKDVHLPSPSYWPLIVSLGIAVVGYGLIFSLWLAAIGAVILLGAIFGWVFEPPDDPDVHAHDGHGQVGDDTSDPDQPSAVGAVIGSSVGGES